MKISSILFTISSGISGVFSIGLWSNPFATTPYASPYHPAAVDPLGAASISEQARRASLGYSSYGARSLYA